MKDVNDAEINGLAEQIKNLESAIREIQNLLETLGALKVHADAWQKLTREKEQIAQAIEEAQQLLVNAEQIDQKASRLTELQEVLPILKDIFDENQHLLKRQDEMANQRDEVTRQEALLTELEPKLGQAQTRLETLTNQQEEKQRIQREANQTLQNTEADYLKLERIKELRQQLNALDEDMTRLFPDDLGALFTRMFTLAGSKTSSFGHRFLHFERRIAKRLMTNGIRKNPTNFS
jgi:chromosome segregation ATPase